MDMAKHLRTVLLSAILLALPELFARNTGVHAQTSPQTADRPGSGKVSTVRMEAILRTMRNAVTARPDDEVPVGNLVDALVRFGRKDEALAEADRFVKRGTAGASLYAQRGFIRRELNELAGATQDFYAAIAIGGLSADQLRNVRTGLSEIQGLELQVKLQRAQDDLTRGHFADAGDQAALILVGHPASEPAMRIRVEALAGGGRKREALADADRFLERGAVSPVLRAQRGFLRRELKDIAGAAQDFSATLANNELSSDQRRNVEASLAEAQVATFEQQLERAESALKRKDYVIASQESRAALLNDPKSESAVRIRMESLSAMGRKRDAVTEANTFIAANPASPLRAQRGYLLRELQDLPGSIEDFTAALAGSGLSAEQRQNAQLALAEARVASEPVNSGSRHGTDTTQPARQLSKQEMQAEAERLISRGQGKGWMYAQRGFARFKAENYLGAVKDFNAALGRRDLSPGSISDIRYTRTVAIAKLAERDGRPRDAEAAYRHFLKSEPARADGWYNLGYLLLKDGRRKQGADALHAGLERRPVGAAYLDAANAYITTDAALASRLYRLGLDRWYAGDPSLVKRSQVDLERVKNEVVEADASIRTFIGGGGITARPASAGGNNLFGGAESSVRFDGRYLPTVVGLEAFARGFTGKDANGIPETDVAMGLRFRPFTDINFYVSAAVDHFFQPTSETQFVMNWGLGFGADPYPYEQGWKPFWNFLTIGAWRTADERVLEDARVNLGYLYEFRTPSRMAIGPTLLAVAGYDNKATTPWAAGIGPSLLSYFYLGGDNYRSYDAILTIQAGYIFNIGPDERQRGWRAQIGVVF